MLADRSSNLIAARRVLQSRAIITRCVPIISLAGRERKNQPWWLTCRISFSWPRLRQRHTNPTAGFTSALPGNTLSVSTRSSAFVSEDSVYRLLKSHGLITSQAFILMKAADRFANPTTAPNQLWQSDFTYLKLIGWGWF